MFLPITVLTKHFVLTNTMIKSKTHISYLLSKVIALNVFVLFRAKFSLYVLARCHACAKVLGLRFVYLLFYAF